ncbi:MAG: MotA/TolQ/ExbB proton channel family protein [Verrucomicrobia bacterium]|nr:MotA/TolQ/ExbB proton channel family protein [Verrucomicrobiota bacterium]
MRNKLNTLFIMPHRWTAVIALLVLGTAFPSSAFAAETLWQTLKEGGPMLILTGVLSILTVGLLLESALRLRVPKAAPKPIVDLLQKAVADGNYQEAWRVCDKNPCFLTNVLKPAVQRVGRGKEVVREILGDHALKEAMGWRARCSYLSMIGVIAPMFGLLGTVMGMIHAFAALAGGGIIADPTKLAGAISEALVNTAAGLFVAVPGFMGFYFFRNRTQEIIVAVEDVINILLEDVPYEQLQGIKIGAQLEAELSSAATPAAPAGDAAAAPASSAEMPKAAPAEGAVIVPCPNCNAQIPQGIPSCPNCKSHLEWA